MTKKSWFDSREGKNLSLLYIVQIGAAVHPASYSMLKWPGFEDLKMNGRLQLVPKLKMYGAMLPVLSTPLRPGAYVSRRADLSQVMWLEYFMYLVSCLFATMN